MLALFPLSHGGSIAILPRIRPQKFLDDSGNVQWFVTDVCIRNIYIYNYNIYIYIYICICMRVHIV